MMRSRENAKKLVFPAYFRHFLPEKYVFRKLSSFAHEHILGMSFFQAILLKFSSQNLPTC